jgi:hypothetical protein
LLWGEGASCATANSQSNRLATCRILNSSATTVPAQEYVTCLMRRFSRLLLIWILAFALPLQGVFAGTLQHCVGGEHQVAFEEGFSSVHSHDEAVDLDAHSDIHATHSHAPMHTHIEPSSSSHSHHGTGLKGSCSACAACCSSAAPPPTPVVLVPQTAEHAVPAFVSFAVVTFVTDGPERPPRITLA